MQLFYFAVIDLLIAWALVIPCFIIAKVLTQNWKLCVKEVLYLFSASLLTAFAVRIFQGLNMATLNIIIDFSLIVFIFFYFYKAVDCPIKESFILTFITFLINLLISVPIVSIMLLFFSDFTSIGGYSDGFIPILIYALLLYAISISVSFLLERVFRKPLTSIKQVGHLQSTSIYIIAPLFLFYFIMVTIQYTTAESITLFSWNSVVIVICTLATFICFLFYTRFQKTQSTLREKEIEHRTLLYYMDECEHQQSAMHKFRHDQKNILSSLDLYVEEQDWNGLMQYYTSSIKPTFAVITQSEFALEDLSKIKVREIKSVLAAKLNMAQNLGIEVQFNVVSEIDDIPTDSVSLVRMLGIILDNAIEALEELDTAGTLFVTCFKIRTSINFVVQNTCRADIPPLNQLKQLGFSTKGKGRGIGLCNLSELANALPNVALQTSIEDGKFAQTLIIGSVV